nr:uncharacterized protein LOC128704522 isoform X2 [Cherax quadricarinatus]
MGASSLAEVAATLPSALTTDVTIMPAKKELEEGQWRLPSTTSVSYSTLLHHRMSMWLHKPKWSETKISSRGLQDMRAGMKSFCMKFCSYFISRHSRRASRDKNLITDPTLGGRGCYDVS